MYVFRIERTRGVREKNSFVPKKHEKWLKQEESEKRKLALIFGEPLTDVFIRDRTV